MAERGAQPGNQNAAKLRVWTQAIERALEKRSKLDRNEALDALAEKLLTQCDGGDMAALKELGDRLEGKPKQLIEGPGPEGEHFVVQRPQLTKEEWLNAHGVGTPARPPG